MSMKASSSLDPDRGVWLVVIVRASGVYAWQPQRKAADDRGGSIFGTTIRSASTAGKHYDFSSGQSTSVSELNDDL